MDDSERKLISGVQVHPLKQIKDPRGMVMHWVRNDSEYFNSFGEAYFSTVNNGVVKGWKKHLEMTQNFAVPQGSIQFVLYDDRPDSPTLGHINEVKIGIDNYRLLHLPPNIWYGFKGQAEPHSMVANCTDIPFCENEVERIPLKGERVPHVWSKN